MTINQEWVFKKEINLTHIFATISLIISALIFGSSMDKRIELNKANIQHMSKSHSELRSDIKAINNKLDRLLQSRSEGR